VRLFTHLVFDSVSNCTSYKISVLTICIIHYFSLQCGLKVRQQWVKTHFTHTVKKMFFLRFCFLAVFLEKRILDIYSSVWFPWFLACPCPIISITCAHQPSCPSRWKVPKFFNPLSPPGIQMTGNIVCGTDRVEKVSLIAEISGIVNNTTRHSPHKNLLERE